MIHPRPILSEAQLHKAAAQFLAATLPPEVIWTTIGHGGGGKIRGAQLKAMGVKRGVPDLLLCWWDGWRTRIGWIELKSAKGRASPEQTTFMDCARDLAHDTTVCRSLKELEDILKLWRVPTQLAA